MKIYDAATNLFWNNGKIFTFIFHCNVIHSSYSAFTLSNTKNNCESCDGNMDFYKKERNKMKNNFHCKYCNFGSGCSYNNTYFSI